MKNKNAQINETRNSQSYQPVTSTNLLPAVQLLQQVDSESAEFIQIILDKPVESWSTHEITAIEQMVIAAEQLETVGSLPAGRIKADLDRMKQERGN